MHPVLRGLLAKTAVGGALIAVGVPFLQGQALGLTTAQPPELRISGDVDELSVSRPGRLTLTVANPGTEDAVVRRLTGGPVHEVAGCRITVEPFTGELVVPAEGSARQDLVVRIAGSRCVGASWDLVYAAS